MNIATILNNEILVRYIYIYRHKKKRKYFFQKTKNLH